MRFRNSRFCTITSNVCDARMFFEARIANTSLRFVSLSISFFSESIEAPQHSSNDEHREHFRKYFEFGHYLPLTRFRRGLAFLADLLALRVELASIAPAAFFPRPWLLAILA